ncbi:hypothetical protein DIPPA_29642 [Diplonema papillatum]|nr:hypothetical protein DIPPA_29642 [Diplonema papillatum]
MNRLWAPVAVRQRFVRTLIARDGVTDDDRRWWEWHIPTKQHKGPQTTVLYLDGIGRFTWKVLIERNIFTVEDLSKTTDDEVAEMERCGALQIAVAREHAKVFMKTMMERERELALQQTSWDKEVERILQQREAIAEANRRKWEATNQLWLQERQKLDDTQRTEIAAVLDAYDYGPGKAQHQQSRYDTLLGKADDGEEYEAEADEAREEKPSTGSSGNPFR